MYELDFSQVPVWLFTAYIFAVNIFWLQHWMYVSMYSRVALMVPLTFRYQTEQVKAKRTCYERALLTLNLAVYATFFGLTILELVIEVNYFAITVLWTTFGTTMAIALCLSLRRIRHYSSSLTNIGLQASRGLLLAHQVSFVSGVVINFFGFVVGSTHILETEDQSHGLTNA